MNFDDIPKKERRSGGHVQGAVPKLDELKFKLLCEKKDVSMSEVIRTLVSKLLDENKSFFEEHEQEIQRFKEKADVVELGYLPTGHR